MCMKPYGCAAPKEHHCTPDDLIDFGTRIRFVRSYRCRVCGKDMEVEAGK